MTTSHTPRPRWGAWGSSAAWAASTLVAAFASLGAAARPAGAQPAATVEVDLKKRLATPSPVPFGQRLIFRGEVPDTATDAVILSVREVPRFGADVAAGAAAKGSGASSTGNECYVWLRKPPASPTPVVPPDTLPHANTRASEATYSLGPTFEAFSADRRFEVRITVAEVPAGMYIARWPGDGCAPLDSVEVRRFDGSPVSGTNRVRVTDTLSVFFVTDATYRNHFDADAGVLYAYGAQYAGIATGVHLYVAPITAEEDLAAASLTGSHEFFRRVSLNAGFAFQEVGTSAGVAAPTSAGIPYVGVGLRGPLYWRWVFGKPGDAKAYARRQRLRPLLQGMRVSAGRVWFKQKDANPLVDKQRTKHDLYTTLTVDLALRDVIAPLGRFFK